MMIIKSETISYARESSWQFKDTSWRCWIIVHGGFIIPTTTTTTEQEQEQEQEEALTS